MKRLGLIIGLGLAMAVTTLQAATTKAPPGKQTGFSGDPARKRGLEVGYDKGFKAGKTDKQKGLKADPSTHEEYKDPKKEYRYEYGSASSFFAGFRSGFMGGYKQGYGDGAKIKMMNPDGTLVKTSSTPATGKTTPTSSKARKTDASSDAL